MRSGLKIVIATGCLASYPEGGGVWMCFLQYALGLRALGHEVFWLDIMAASKDESDNQARVNAFFHTFQLYAAGTPCALLLLRNHNHVRTGDSQELVGITTESLSALTRSADIIWNFACSAPGDLLARFKRRALIDVDPGMVQISALTWDMGIEQHDAFFTTGLKMHQQDCGIPALGRHWHTFLPCVYLPMWPVVDGPAKEAPFTSVTQWNWGEYEYNGRTFSISKRMAYLQYLELPTHCGRAFELAANLDARDVANDRPLLQRNGWRLVDPHEVARTPQLYAEYIRRSRAELSCAKPIYRELKTGWLSDRSACYLAAGRPVLAESTGFEDIVDAGEGLMTCTSVADAVARVRDIDSDYRRHSSAARAFAETHLDSSKVLTKMLAECW